MTAPTAVYNVPLGIEGLLYVGDAGATPTVALGDDQKMKTRSSNGIREVSPCLPAGMPARKSPVRSR
jgi:hypothetical protein